MLTESWVEGKSVEEKRCTTNRENRSLMRIVKQNRFKNLGELHKEWTEAGVKASRATTHRRVMEFGYSCRIPLVKPLLNHRQRQRRLTWAYWTVAQWSNVLFSDESKFCISFGNQGPESGGRVEKLIAQVAWSPVLSFHSLWWFGVQCHLLVLVHCVFWKPTSLHPFTKKFWSTSCFLLLTSFLKMLIYFPAGFGTCPHCQKHQKLLNDHGVGVLDWPANSPDLNPRVYCQEENEKRDQKMQMSWRPLSKKPGLPYHPAVPQTDHLHATPIEAVIKAKGALPSIEYIYSKLTYFPEGQQFTKKNCFIGLMKYSNLLR